MIVILIRLFSAERPSTMKHLLHNQSLLEKAEVLTTQPNFNEITGLLDRQHVDEGRTRPLKAPCHNVSQ